MRSITTNGAAHNVLSRRSIDDIRPLKVIVVGAGVSGILAGIRFPQRVRDLDLVIYDKNEDIGGTWFENNYPGIACDIPAHSYQLSFESNPSWSSFYAGGAEILEYWRRIVEKYDLRKYMRLGNKVLEARWNEDKAKWVVKLQNIQTGDIFEDQGDALFRGVGSLNSWKWPDIKGLHDFKGKLMHSAEWDMAYDYKGKNVAIIGAGSSGIQITPSIQPHVARLDHYVRGRTWISSTFLSDQVSARGASGNFQYSEEEKQRWASNPSELLEYRKLIEDELQSAHSSTHRGSAMHKEGIAAFTQLMQDRLAKKPHIASHLIPTFSPGCKRLTPGPGYLESLTEENVQVIPTPIDHINATGIRTADGAQRDVDLIVCATGFDTSQLHQFPIFGVGGTKLQERWKAADRPETYLTMAVDGFPNMFMSLGPNSALGSGNLLLSIEGFALYAAQALQKMQSENILAMQPKPRAVQDFSDFCELYFKDTVFAEECSSWYKGGSTGAKKGRVNALWPGSSLHAMQALKRPRWEDWEYEYVDGNPWGWFGDGWSVMDRELGREKTAYLEGAGMVGEDLPGKNGGEREVGEGDADMEGIVREVERRVEGEVNGREKRRREED